MYTYVFVCAPQLSQLSADCTAKRKELENRHLLVQQRVRSPHGSAHLSQQTLQTDVRYVVQGGTNTFRLKAERTL